MQNFEISSDLMFDNEKKKSISGEYVHDYGDFVFHWQTPLEKLLKKYRSTGDPPVRFIGEFIHPLAVCSQGKGSKVIELFDPIDIRLADDQEGAVEGETYTVVINQRTKKTVFVRWLDEPFYKWETESGMYLILLQSDIDTLTQKEKEWLHIP